MRFSKCFGGMEAYRNSGELNVRFSKWLGVVEVYQNSRWINVRFSSGSEVKVRLCELFEFISVRDTR